MKGRPITTEEFERMLEATDAVAGARAAESWSHLLRGLWWTGLRLGEAMALRWDHKPGGVSVRMDGRKSVLLFDVGSQKSGRVEQVPLAPEAVQLLEISQRSRGFVFEPERLDVKGGPMARHIKKISKIISAIGAKAGVVVDHESGKTASAHDLRRAFADRWSKRVMPAQLMALMRHASIDTTMTYYVGLEASEAASGLWDAVGNNLGNSQASTASENRDGKTEGVVR